MTAADPPGPEASDAGSAWTEEDSLDFQRYGDILVPRRAEQMRTICDLVPPLPSGATVVDLGCGQGLLSAALLERYPHARVRGVDASAAMVGAAAAHNLASGRFEAHRGTLEEFPTPGLEPPAAVVSSLAIHHLDDAGKRALFGRIRGVLRGGGRFVVADIVAPISPAAKALAARQWDGEVESAARRLDIPEAVRVFREERWNLFSLEVPDPEDKPALLVDQLNWLRDAGFVQVDAFWAFAGHAIFGGRVSSAF